MEWGAISFPISFFLTQRSNLHLLSPAWQADSLPMSHLGSPNNVSTLNANKKENEWGLWGKAIVSWGSFITEEYYIPKLFALTLKGRIFSDLFKYSVCQQYVNREFPDVQAGFRQGRGIRDQIANIDWIIEKAREFQKNIYFYFTDYVKAFGCVDKLWKILKEMGIPDNLTCLLKNLYAGQEATVRTGHGTTDWFQMGKGVCQGCILSSYYFTYMQSIS